jgi:hypothetical protein
VEPPRHTTGSHLDIFGKDFQNATDVEVGGIDAPITQTGTDFLSVNVPAGLPNGVTDIVIEGPFQTVTLSFEVGDYTSVSETESNNSQGSADLLGRSRNFAGATPADNSPDPDFFIYQNAVPFLPYKLTFTNPDSVESLKINGIAQTVNATGDYLFVNDSSEGVLVELEAKTPSYSAVLLPQ